MNDSIQITLKALTDFEKTFTINGKLRLHELKMPIVGVKICLGVPTTFVAEIEHDENKSFAFLVPPSPRGWHNIIGIWLEGKSRLRTS